MTGLDEQVMGPPLNVLITSASRKVLLVRAFRAAAKALGGGRIVAADIDPSAAALYDADDARLVPRSDDPSFIPSLLQICRDEQIGLIVPTRDGELPVLAGQRALFAKDGILVLISPPDAIATCQDKARFTEVLASLGHQTPRAWSAAEDPPLPAFVKPRFGQGGRGASVVRTRAELNAAVELLGEDLIIQEPIEAPEVTVDAFLDLASRPISCVPRLRLSVVAGKSVVSRTVDDPALVDECARLAGALGLVGHVTIQAFRERDRISFIEINPRYGGAAHLGFAAGAPTPEFAIRLARGERLEPQIGEYQADLVMLRYADDRIMPLSSLIRDH